MKQFFLTVLGVFTGLILFVVVLPVVLIIAAAASSSEPARPANAVLELDLREGISDQAPTDPFAVFGGAGLSTIGIVDTLAQAEKDAHIKVLLDPPAGSRPRSRRRRRDPSGRSTLSRLGQGRHRAFPGLPARRHGDFELHGRGFGLRDVDAEHRQLPGDRLLGRQRFPRARLRQVRRAPEFEQRYEYKNAVNEYTQSDYTGPHREAMTAWMTSIYDSPSPMRPSIERSQPRR